MDQTAEVKEKPEMIDHRRSQIILMGFLCAFIVLMLYASCDARSSSASSSRRAIETAQSAYRALLQRDPQGAERILSRFLGAHPDCREVVIYQLLGNALGMEKRWHEAQRAYRRALALKPENRALLINLAAACFGEGRYREARDLYLRAYRLTGSGKPDLVYRAAVCAYKNREFLMVERFLAPITHDPAGNPPQWWQLRINALVKRGRKREAASLLTRLLGEHPLDADGWKLLARLRIEFGDYRRAAIALEIADQIRSLNEKERRSLAAVYLHLDLPLQAAEQLLRIYGPHPDPAQCDRLASLFERAGDGNRALRYLEEVISLRPTAERYLRKGRILYALARRNEAVRALQESVRLNPGNNLGQWLLAISAWEAGDVRSAETALKHVVGDPSYGRRAAALLDLVK